MSNDFFTKTNVPAQNTAGASSEMRAEFALIEAAFDKMIDQQYAEYVVKLRKEKPDVPWEQIKAEAKGMISASFFGFRSH